MNLLRLTRANDRKNLYINPKEIVSMESYGSQTLILAQGQKYYVIESPEDIIYTIDSRQNKTNS